MDPTKPLGVIKDVTTGTLSRGITVPGRLAARAFGAARGAATVGRQVAEEVSGRAEKPTDPVERVEGDESPSEAIDVSRPVNVVEQLGLDPTPPDDVPSVATDQAEPVTGIDAQADPDSVDVTPADVADKIGTRRPR